MDGEAGVSAPKRSGLMDALALRECTAWRSACSSLASTSRSRVSLKRRRRGYCAFLVFAEASARDAALAGFSCESDGLLRTDVDDAFRAPAVDEYGVMPSPMRKGVLRPEFAGAPCAGDPGVGVLGTLVFEAELVVIVTNGLPPYKRVRHEQNSESDKCSKMNHKRKKSLFCNTRSVHANKES